MPATIVLTGRLAADPETRTTHSGTTVTELRVPNDSGWGDNKTTTWWGVVLFGKRAEQAANHLRKGSWVTVTGEPVVETYDKRDGSKGFSAKVKGSDWSFVGPKPQDSAPAQGRRYSAPSRSFGDEPSLSDVPF